MIKPIYIIITKSINEHNGYDTFVTTSGNAENAKAYKNKQDSRRTTMSCDIYKSYKITSTRSE